MSIPDFLAEKTTVQEVVHALRTNGCCAIRALIPNTWLDVIRKRVEEEYALMDEIYSNGNMTEEDYRHCYRYGILRPFEQKYQLEMFLLDLAAPENQKIKLIGTVMVM